jgi:SAM-dependent methyltransferase
MPTGEMMIRRKIRDAVFAVLDTADSITGRRGTLTPPRRLMNGGTDSLFRNDFHAIGQRLFGYLVDIGGVRPTDRVLDIGCSVGRIAIPFTEYLSTGTYDGFDIERPAVEFCQRVITPRHPNFRFVHADLYNAHYTPDSETQAGQYRFPYGDERFDFVFLTSVFTHMQRPETEHYLSEIARVLAPGGRLFATFFLLDETSEAAIAEGKADFTFAHQGNGARVEKAEDPDFAVAHPLLEIVAAMETRGLRMASHHQGAWIGRPGRAGYQDIILAVY